MLFPGYAAIQAALIYARVPRNVTPRLPRSAPSRCSRPRSPQVRQGALYEACRARINYVLGPSWSAGEDDRRHAPEAPPPPRRGSGQGQDRGSDGRAPTDRSQLAAPGTAEGRRRQHDDGPGRRRLADLAKLRADRRPGLDVADHGVGEALAEVSVSRHGRGNPGERARLVLVARRLGRDVHDVLGREVRGVVEPGAGRLLLDGVEERLESAGHRVGISVPWSSRERHSVGRPFFLPIDPSASGTQRAPGGLVTLMTSDSNVEEEVDG